MQYEAANKKLIQAIVLGVGALAVVLAAHPALAVTAEEHKAQLRQNSAWFVANAKQVETWSPKERLGAAEWLYYSLDSLDSGRAEAQAVLSKLLQSLTAESGPEKAAAGEANEFAARALILQILLEPPDSETARKLSRRLVELDGDNGLPWMIQAEQAWLEGRALECLKDCQKAVAAPKATLQDQQFLVRMAAASAKAGRLDVQALRTILLMPDTDRENIMFFRHAALLSFYNDLASIVGKPLAQNMKAGLGARHYLALLAASRPLGRDAGLLVMQNNMLLASIGFSRDQKEAEHAAILQQLPPALQDERKQLKTKLEDAEVQVFALYKVVDEGNMEELNQVIQDPSRWWQANRAAFAAKWSAPSVFPAGPPDPYQPTGMIVCDDGATVPMAAAKPLVNADGREDPFKYTVPGHGVGYREMRCNMTGKTWAYGKNGQTTSPFVPKP